MWNRIGTILSPLLAFCSSDWQNFLKQSYITDEFLPTYHFSIGLHLKQLSHPEDEGKIFLRSVGKPENVQDYIFVIGNCFSLNWMNGNLTKVVNFVLFVPCIFLQLIHQPSNSLNKIQFMTNINFLNVSGLVWHPHGLFPIKGIQIQFASLGVLRPHWND